MRNEGDGMRFEEKLKQQDTDAIWQEYCGFLDLSLEEYMHIQNRLMQEQVALWSQSGLGRMLLGGRQTASIDEFRRLLPLTTYEDYADILLAKQAEMLADEPIIWIQTTWEGGKHPLKLAPYTRGMLDTYTHNVLACLILSTSRAKGEFDVKATDHILYGLAPLPYATGLFPLALGEEIGIEFLPPVKEAIKLSFGERNVKGFKLGLSKGIDFFFGLGSVAYYVSLSLAAMSSGTKGAGKKELLLKCSPGRLLRLIKAQHQCKREGRSLKPRDLFTLKGFMVAGTDNRCYKDLLEDLWGVRPMELFAGTEPSCVGTETWTRQGMVFFPDTCFYEFIPEAEMLKNQADATYQPQTYLMDQVQSGEKYELVISVLKGGAFMRYRVGDVYRCLGVGHAEDGTRIPRFEYLDRVDSIIDIAGFTRISEAAIASAVELSGLAITYWFAAKEFSQDNKPFLHLYVELSPQALTSQAVSELILREQLTIYFKYVDQDYHDLEHILGMDPLEVTILKCGTTARWQKRMDRLPRRINPPVNDVLSLLTIQEEDYRTDWRERGYHA